MVMFKITLRWIVASPRGRRYSFRYRTVLVTSADSILVARGVALGLYPDGEVIDIYSVTPEFISKFPADESI